MDLDVVADDLYRLHPSEFIEARDARAKEARAAGDKVTSAMVAKFKRPTQSAWALNLLARESPEEIERLLHVGQLLRDAQSSLVGDELRRLGSQRRQIVAAMTADARALARGAGHPVADQIADEISQTLDAAISDPATAEALLSGRLLAPSRPVGGFGDVVIAVKPHLKLVRPSGENEPTPATVREGDRQIERLVARKVNEIAQKLNETETKLHAAVEELARRSGELEVARGRAHEVGGQLANALAAADQLASELEDARALASSVAKIEREARVAVSQSAEAEAEAMVRVRRLEQSLRSLRSR